MTELKPCPFCGSDSITNGGGGIFGTYLWCVNCGIHGPSKENQAAATVAWNNRPAALRDELRANALGFMADKLAGILLKLKEYNIDHHSDCPAYIFTEPSEVECNCGLRAILQEMDKYQEVK